MHVRLTGLRMAPDSLDPSSEPPFFPSVGRSDSKTGRLATRCRIFDTSLSTTNFTTVMRHSYKIGHWVDSSKNRPTLGIDNFTTQIT